MRKGVTVLGILAVLAFGTATLFDRPAAAFSVCTYEVHL